MIIFCVPKSIARSLENNAYSDLRAILFPEAVGVVREPDAKVKAHVEVIT
jgi:hypothetical protein